MLFNSVGFFMFLLIITILHYVVPQKYRWLVLLIGSYYFYMNWKPVYAFLIFFSTISTYFTGVLLSRNEISIVYKKITFGANIFINIAILVVFKYYNFLNDSVFSSLDLLGVRWALPDLDFLLPVGISFYTFQAIGYTVDVYKGKVLAERHFGLYALFVSFFPQLVAGPIERTSHLLPQFRKKVGFEFGNLEKGISLMVWGLFVKVCIADRLAIYVNSVYGNIDYHNGTSLLFATILFAFQIYSDFYGYSVIAIGSAKILGFDLMDNFKRPYFAQSISEFWGRWHISLSTWFRDYLYIPLGGSRVGFIKHIRNLFITFLISGLWHGANWTFIIWGGVHSLFLISQVIWTKRNLFNKSNRYTKFLSMMLTFFCVVLAWVFFRASSAKESFIILKKIFFERGELFIDKTVLSYALLFLIVLILKEFKDERGMKLAFLSSKNIWIRTFAVASVIYCIVLFGVEDSNQFIYFQF